MDTARTFRRIIAFLIDSVFTILCLLPVWIQLLGSYLKTGTPSVEISWVIVGFLFQLFYRWLFLYFLGGTVGKLVMGLRVVPYNNPQGDLGLLQSLLRVLTDYLSLFFGQALRALALVRLDRTHVSDWVAETRVMQLVPRKTRPRRHWIVAILVILFSFLSQFQSIYRTVQQMHWVDGQITFDASY